MRTKNSAKTFIYGIILTSIIAIIGLFKTKILITYMGDDYVGIYQLFYQIYVYLSLVDGGVSAGIAYYLYRPIEEKNNKKISEIINGARKYFNIIGIIIIAIGFVLSLNIMFFIKDTSIDSLYIKICFILFIIASASNYFVASHAALYEAEQKLYKSSNLNHLLTIVKSIIEMILVILGFKLLALLISFVILAIIKNTILLLQSRKDHRFLDKSLKKDTSFTKEANNLLVQKISTVVFENIDIILISKYLGLTDVVIYTAYFQITNMLATMIKRLNSAVLPSVGNLLISAKEKASAIFDELNSILFFIGSCLCIPLYFFLNSFIKLWYGNNYVVNDITLIGFILVLYFVIIGISLEVFIKADGKFKSIKKYSVIQSILNLVLSWLLIKKYSIAGVLYATVTSFVLCNFLRYPVIISKEILNRKTSLYYMDCFKYLIGLVPTFLVCKILTIYLPTSNLFIWAISGIIIFVVNLLLTYMYYKIINKLLFVDRIKLLIKNRKVKD